MIGQSTKKSVDVMKLKKKAKTLEKKQLLNSNRSGRSDCRFEFSVVVLFDGDFQDSVKKIQKYSIWI
jgi:hypothetical protein